MGCGSPSSISVLAAVVGLATRRQRRGVAGGVAAEVGDGGAQTLDQRIEDLFESVRCGSWPRTSSNRDMFHFLGDAGFRLDADQPAESFVASQFVEHGLGGEVPQGDPQDDDAPEHGDGVLVASLAACDAERLEQLAVGQGGEEILDGLERGAVFESVPGEEWFGGVNDHHQSVAGGPRVGKRGREATPLLRNKSPKCWRGGGKIRENRTL